MSTIPQVLPDEQELDQNEEGTAKDLGKWNERLPEDLQGVLRGISESICNEFKYPRRLEVMKAWKGRCFWNELQHLTWDWDSECWNVTGPAGAGPSNSNRKRDSAVLYTTNMYQGFGESFIAIVTQAVPNLRFEPEDASEAVDVETAKEADRIKQLVQHENDPIELMARAAFIGWTDGRIHGWTRWEMDKRTNKPRETQSIEGVLEVKVPVIYNKQEDYNYVQYSNEYHVSVVRAKVRSREFPPDYYKKIKGGASGNGQDVYERTARISVKQGISLSSAGGDTYSSLCTTQRTWMRPSEFLSDCVEEKWVEELEELFPDGCYCEFDNGVYTGSRNANMDDEWAIENIMQGDGSNRPAKGTCLVSVQERANDIINLTQDVYEKTIPTKSKDEKLWNIDAINTTRAMPGNTLGINMDSLPPGDSLANHVYDDMAAAVSSDMLQYLKSLMNDIPEFLTGISAILFGSDQGGDKSGKALSIQQAAAMGRIGLPFRVMKRLYAKMMEQGIRCCVTNRTEDTTVGIPDENGKTETIAVRVGGLDGKVRCFPASDENYPESWMSKRNTYMQLLMEGNTDPVMKAILSNPKNQNFAKKMIGLQELELPDADSWEKQNVEINLLLASAPTAPEPQAPTIVPNPLTGEPTPIQPGPIPPQSSIPIDPDYDNHEAEFLTVQIFLNSSKGQQLKLSADPKELLGLENVRLHGLAHKAALQAAMAAAAPPPSVAPPPAGPGGSKPPSDKPAGGPPSAGPKPAGEPPQKV